MCSSDLCWSQTCALPIFIGPSALGIAHIGRDIGFLRELGVAFLFLMAGYEIDVNELRGTGGRHAMIAWGGSLALAFATVCALVAGEGPSALRSGDLVQALARLVDSRRGPGLDIGLDARPPRDLARPVEVVVLRTVQEALSKWGAGTKR